ncbi:hypothetical protein PMM47T1_24199 [Pseudomonas sp. M47T1]|uniref:hypothetical protein n=1 Tax=Pseudomonas sp. M47T1 TaxID=1179778 RepID=UPI0002607E0F|nr:hypothetical protein [Pseudomonas sp. M47T1]EIK94052.1 hypothetical protein PMM47T1_24199 [Pseudomonas sp. M47T1]
MNFCKLAIITLLGFGTASAFAQDGSDRTTQRMIDHQQAYLAAQKADHKDTIVKTQPEAGGAKSKAIANCS